MAVLLQSGLFLFDFAVSIQDNLSMKSMNGKLTAPLIILVIFNGAAGAASFLAGGWFLRVAILLVLLLLSGFAVYFLIKVLVLNQLYLMKSAVDGNVPYPLDRKDEFGELARRINQLSVKNDEELRRENSDFARKITERENGRYLQNINDGLLFIDYGQIISPYYSKALEELFDREEIAGQHLSDFLYPDREKFHDRRKELEKYIVSLFHDPAGIGSGGEVVENPLHKIWISRDDGKRILVDGSLRKIEEDGELVQLMIIFRDRTDEGILVRKLDEKDMRSDFEIESIVAILRAGPGPFLQFIEESGIVLERFRKDIPILDEPVVIQRSFRDINSMKCSSAYFEFRAVEKLCHNLEDILSEFRKGNFSRREALDIIVDDIYIQFDHIRKLINRFQEFLSSAEGRIYKTDRNDQEHFFDTLRIMMARHSDELGKDFELSLSSEYENFSRIGELKTPVIHLLRNAADYGIELPEEREKNGKNRRGKIELKIVGEGDGHTKVIVSDDGAGMDFERLRVLAVEKGFIKSEDSPGQANLIRTLFSSGFSSRDEMSGLSGRGVGLDAVKDQISRMGGRISVKTERLKGSRFTIILPE